MSTDPPRWTVTTATGDVLEVIGSRPDRPVSRIFERVSEATETEREGRGWAWLDSEESSVLPYGWQRPMVDKWRDRGFDPDGDLFEGGSATRELATAVHWPMLWRGLRAGDPSPEDLPSRRIAFERDFDATASILGGIAALPEDDRSTAVATLRTSTTSKPAGATADVLADHPDADAGDWDERVQRRLQAARRTAARLAHAEAYEFHLGPDDVVGTDPALVEWQLPDDAVERLQRPIRYGDVVTVDVGGNQVIVEARRRVTLVGPPGPYRFVVWAGPVVESAHSGIEPGHVVGVAADGVVAVERGEWVAAADVPEWVATAGTSGQCHAALLTYDRRGDVGRADFSPHVETLLDLLFDDDPLIREKATTIVQGLATVLTRPTHYQRQADTHRGAETDPDALLPVADRLVDLAGDGRQLPLSPRRVVADVARERPAEMATYGDRLLQWVLDGSGVATAMAVREIASVDEEFLRRNLDDVVAVVTSDSHNRKELDEALARAIERDPLLAEGHVGDLAATVDTKTTGALDAVVNHAPELVAPHADVLADSLGELSGDVAATVAGWLDDLAAVDPDVAGDCIGPLADALDDHPALVSTVLATAADYHPDAVSDAAPELPDDTELLEEIDLDGPDTQFLATDEYPASLEGDNVPVDNFDDLQSYVQDHDELHWSQHVAEFYWLNCPDCGGELVLERAAIDSSGNLVGEFHCLGSENHPDDYVWVRNHSGGIWHFAGTGAAEETARELLVETHERCSTCARLRSSLEDHPSVELRGLWGPKVETTTGETLAEGHEAVLNVIADELGAEWLVDEQGPIGDE